MHYTVRYRRCWTDGDIALIVQDEQGRAYLFVGGRLRALPGGKVPAHLAWAIGPRNRWTSVPKVAPYTLEGLLRLTGAMRGDCVDGRPAPVTSSRDLPPRPAAKSA
ncbi:MAG: hypothetical protein M3Q65_17305 [Chloroflexota bacterium]|nr:hypothetical protein [Chloroflexota bacterium]